jgi:hypothetical protein
VGSEAAVEALLTVLLPENVVAQVPYLAGNVEAGFVRGQQALHDLTASTGPSVGGREVVKVRH